MIEPGIDWQWCIDEGQGVLALNMGPSLYFLTALPLSKVNQSQLCGQDQGMFTLEQMGDFHAFMDSLTGLNGLADAQRLQVVLNALAAKYFAREVGLKSWFFQPASDDFSWQVGPMSLATHSHSAVVLVVEQHGSAATCMLLSPSLALNEQKSLNQFTLLKVMNDRLTPLMQVHDQELLCQQAS